MIVERLDPKTTDDALNCRLHIERYHWAASQTQGAEALDIACGVGYGSAILAGAPCAPHVLGVDRSEEAIATARQRHDSERIAFERIDDAETAAFGDRRFDTVVSLETLEHLSHPVRFLRRTHGLLAPGGRLIVSAPVRERPGDNPFHKHCFTEETLRAVVSEGFVVEAELSQAGGAFLTLMATRRETPSNAWGLASAKPRVTIILVTWNSLDRVAELVTAIRAFTKTPYRLMIVDNASTDGTREFGRVLGGEPGVVLIENPKNLQCAKATNLAIAATRTDYIIYLCASHALVAEPGWEEPLLRYMDEHRDVGMAGDVWNPGFTLESRHYASGWTPTSHGVEKLRHVQGGAWIARRILFDEVGFFDEESFPHGGMDVEFSYRLLSRSKSLGACHAISCPPAPEKPRRRAGVTVYHPASSELRTEVRRLLGLAPLSAESSIDPRDLAGYRCVRGQVGWFPDGAFLVRGNGPDSGLLSGRAYRDVRVTTRLAFRGQALIKVRIDSHADPSRDGYHVLLGQGRNYLARAGHVLGRFELARPECYLVFELRGSTLSLFLDGRLVVEAEDRVLGEGHVLLGANEGEALFSQVSIEPLG